MRKAVETVVAEAVHWTRLKMQRRSRGEMAHALAKVAAERHNAVGAAAAQIRSEALDLTQAAEGAQVPSVAVAIKQTLRKLSADEAERIAAVWSLARIVDATFGDEMGVLGAALRANGAVPALVQMLGSQDPREHQGALLVLPLDGEVAAKDGSARAGAGECLVAGNLAGLDFTRARITLLTRAA